MCKISLLVSWNVQDELKKLAANETLAIRLSNIANLVLFVAKVYASTESRSLAVIASTLDSLLDLLSGFILWFTSYAMRKPNFYRYPIGKKRMQPVVCLHTLHSSSFFPAFLRDHKLYQIANRKKSIPILRQSLSFFFYF